MLRSAGAGGPARRSARSPAFHVEHSMQQAAIGDCGTAVIESLECRRVLSVAAPGTLDPSFGQGGTVELHLRTPVQTFVSASTALPGGKAMLVGQYGYGLYDAV